MGEIIKELTLNYHPKSYKNNSLFNAINMKISEDGSCLENDNALMGVDVINDFIRNLGVLPKIIHILPCNTELILFVQNITKRPFIDNDIFIVRYDEITKNIAIVYGNYDTKNGIRYIKGINCKSHKNDIKISADFTYNVANALIVSFCIYFDNVSSTTNVSKLFPLSTINLGTFNNGYVENNIWIDTSDVYNDRHLPYELLSNVPEVLMPTFTDLKYTNGKSYQGWYNVYIRYKINNYDYTQWYSVGPRFPVTSKNLNIITDLQGDISNYSPLTFKGFYGSDVDNLSTSFQFNLVGLDSRYTKYQIGFIILNKTLNKHVHTDDINLINSTYLFDRENLIEEAIDTNIYENYYNVKNIVNKQNKLYISNFITARDNQLDVSDVKLTTSYQNIASGLYFQNNSNLYYPGTVESMGNLLPFLLEHGVDIRDLTNTIKVRFLPKVTFDDTLGDANYLLQGNQQQGVNQTEVARTILFKETHQNANFVNDTYTGNNPNFNIGERYSAVCTDNRPYTNPYQWKEVLGARIDVNLFTSNINILLDNITSKYRGINAQTGLYLFSRTKGFVGVTINGINNTIKPDSLTDGYSSIGLKINPNWNGEQIDDSSNIPSNYSAIASPINDDNLQEEFKNVYREANTQYLCVRFFNENDKPLLTIWQPNYDEIETKTSPTLPEDVSAYENQCFNDGQFLDHFSTIRQWGGNAGTYQTEIQRMWDKQLKTVTSTTYDITDIYKYIANYDVFQKIHDNMLSSLIPGEVYDFYIHFIDKYGIPTRGYRLNFNDNTDINNNYRENKVIHINNVDYRYICKLGRGKKFFPGIQIDTSRCYWLTDFTVNDLSTNNFTIYIYANYKSKMYYYDETTEDYILDLTNIAFEFEDENCNSAYCVHKNNDDILNIKLSNIDSMIIVKNGFTQQRVLKDLQNYFLIDHKTNISWQAYAGDTRHPEQFWYWDDIACMITDSDNPTSFVPYYNINGDALFKVPFNERFANSNCSLNVTVTNLHGYSGFFISYKKINERCPLYGYGNMFGVYNNTINVDRNVYPISLLIIQKNSEYTYNTSTYYSYGIYQKDNIRQLCNIYKKQLLFAGDNLGGRLNKGSIYKINDENKVPKLEVEGELLLCQGVVINKNIYSSDNEVLYRLGNIFTSTGEKIINVGLNGYYGAEDCLIYNNEGVTFVNSLPYKSNLDIDTDNDIWKNQDLSTLAMAHIVIERWSNHIFDSRYINFPVSVQYHNDILDKLDKLLTANTRSNKGNINSYIMPINTIDTWQEKLLPADDNNPNIYLIYKPDNYVKNIYDKTIRISNVISDESLINKWRNFNVDDYKFITENKGNITKLIDLGSWLLVHTEHSLFGFDTDNYMKTLDKSVNLQQQEVIDIGYKEFFSEKLGYGGLQSKESSIKGEFGYVWWDKDSKKIYRLDGNNELTIISELIQSYIDNIIKDDVVIFINDVKSKRLFVSFVYNNITLTYNYKFNCWVSFCGYRVFKYISTNTKNITYFASDILFTFSSNFIPDFSFSIIVNENWEIYKYLEWIEYKFKKLDNGSLDGNNYIYDLLKPFSGDRVRIYNDDVDSDELTIETSETSDFNQKDNYTRPYYKLGDWRFNCIREFNNYESNRLFGNYFIFNFIFNNVEGLVKIESFKAITSKFEK